MTDFIATTAQIELGDAFGFSPASVEFVAKATLTVTRGRVWESMITDRLIREIAFNEARAASREVVDALAPLGVDLTVRELEEASIAATKAYDEQYAKTAAEATAEAKKLGLL